ncbi:MAG: hypothetical protein C0623_07910 [Desulfuromonas sp.]|nr:MAG: hypothetical protein C0623_07910 [Desulfuromonas sp.]
MIFLIGEDKSLQSEITSNQALKNKEEELRAIINGARSILGKRTFAASAREIFDHCSRLIGSTSGYVALLTDDGDENEVLFLEDGGAHCTVDPDLPMPIRGLREEAYQGNCAVYHNDFMNSDHAEMMPEGHMGLKNVMFSPLVIDGKTVGIIGMANKPGDFNDRDAEMATVFGELAAIALQNSRYLEEIVALKGIIPICSYCKGIRDDAGYWSRLEEYIESRSEAQFSHGICDTCMAERFGDYLKRPR